MKRKILLILLVIISVIIIAAYLYFIFSSGLVGRIAEWIENSGGEFILVGGIIPIPVGKLFSILGMVAIFTVLPVLIIVAAKRIYKKFGKPIYHRRRY